MKNIDLRVKAVAFLKNEAEGVKNRPHELTFSAKQVSSAVGGYAGALGQIADGVVNDLVAMGYSCSYCRNRKPAVFLISAAH